jgi:membrane protein required for beta-lactamase induction
MPDLSRFGSLPKLLLALVAVLVALYLLIQLMTSFLFGVFYATLILAVVGGAALAWVVFKQQ